MPGVEFPHEPERLIEDDNGNTTKEKDADGPFLRADLQRTEQKRDDIQRWVNIKQLKMAHYEMWALLERGKGRPTLDLVWGNCVEENWRAAASSGEAGGWCCIARSARVKGRAKDLKSRSLTKCRL